MERGSLPVIEQKALLTEMKRLKDDAKRNGEWEQQMERLRHERSAVTEQLRVAYEQKDARVSSDFRASAAAQLGLGADEEAALAEGIWRRVGGAAGGARVRALPEAPPGRVRHRPARRARQRAARRRADGGAAGGPRGGAGVRGGPRRGVGGAQADGRRGAGRHRQEGRTIASIQEETGCALEIRRGAGSVAILMRRRRSRRRRC